MTMSHITRSYLRTLGAQYCVRARDHSHRNFNSGSVSVPNQYQQIEQPAVCREARPKPVQKVRSPVLDACSPCLTCMPGELLEMILSEYLNQGDNLLHRDTLVLLQINRSLRVATMATLKRRPLYIVLQTTKPGFSLFEGSYKELLQKTQEVRLEFDRLVNEDGRTMKYSIESLARVWSEHNTLKSLYIHVPPDEALLNDEMMDYSHLTFLTEKQVAVQYWNELLPLIDILEEKVHWVPDFLVNITTSNNDRSSFLSLAIQANEFLVVRQILHGFDRASINQTKTPQGSPLQVATLYHEAESVARALIKHGADVNEKDVLLNAARNMSVSCVQNLLRHGAKLTTDVIKACSERRGSYGASWSSIEMGQVLQSMLDAIEGSDEALALLESLLPLAVWAGAQHIRKLLDRGLEIDGYRLAVGWISKELPNFDAIERLLNDAGAKISTSTILSPGEWLIFA